MTAFEHLQAHVNDGYDHLKPGDEGFWPFIGFWADDIEPGDRLTFKDDGYRCVVRVVDVSKPTRVVVTTVEGDTFSIGRLNRSFKIDRWGTHSQLSKISVR